MSTQAERHIHRLRLAICLSIPAAVLLGLPLFAADVPKDEKLELLKTFRSEFVPITPGEGVFPPSLRTERGGKTVTVPLDGPFAIAKYEVPQNLYLAIMGNNPSRWRGPRNSVEMVDCDQAVEFCQKATVAMRQAGLIAADQEIRLPTETEWEYCCRAGTESAYSFGDDPAALGDFAWYHGNAAGNDPPVGVKKPNPWGLYDMHGYVWEWCADEVTPDRRAMRGGAWTSSAQQCTSGSRRLEPKTFKGPDVGFRCILASTKQP